MAYPNDRRRFKNEGGAGGMLLDVGYTANSSFAVAVWPEASASLAASQSDFRASPQTTYTCHGWVLPPLGARTACVNISATSFRGTGLP